mmetsp:Transcript_1651/g.2309  ORF Transcript_1651/g.2309 Transcript_1651/m.2309 type:complete len:83 (+) Transcript_1651:130-378(+)
MHHETFEEMQVQKDIIEHWDFLVDSEDMEVKLLSFNGRVIGVELPNTYDYEVVKVNTDKSSAGQHSATLNSGTACLSWLLFV